MCADGSLWSSVPFLDTTKASFDNPSIGDRSLYKSKNKKNKKEFTRKIKDTIEKNLIFA